MAKESFKRKLTAILSADVEGYSRLMGEDEDATIRTLTTYRELMSKLIQKYQGRVVDSPGDNLLAEFTSVVDAVRCAVEIQEELRVRNAELPENRRMEFRIGINLGDVIEEEERIYGDGVNITARVEGLAQGGGICISGTVYDSIKNKLSLSYESLGEHTVKNITEPVRVYRMRVGPEAAAPVVREEKAGPRRWQKAALAAVVTLVVAAGAWAIWNYYLRPSPPSVDIASEERTPLPLPEKPSIAVLPLTNIGGDPEQEYFADGMTDDLITDLSKISGLFVIARNSVFAYKGKTMKVEQIGHELGVRYLLEGSVRKAGDRVRINTQLIDATTGAHLWAERYDRDYQDIFALQDEVIQRIVSALLVKLTPVEEEQLARTYTDNLEAYEYYLHGLQNFHTYTPEGFAAALLMFEKAIGLDPSFAQAYAVRAWAHYLILTMGYLGKVGQIISVTRPTGFTVVGGFRLQGVDFAKRALSLDDRLPMAHSVMALVHLQSRDYDEAVSSVARSVALDPNNAESYNIQAYVLTRAGRHEEALKAIKTAYRLNPKPPARYALTLSEVHFDLRQYAEAIESGKKALGGMPDWKVRQDTLVPSYAYLGQMEEARAELEKLLKQNPQLSISWLKSRAWLYVYKRPEDWEHFLEGHRRAGVPKYPRDTVD